jgi:hypothetical protein
VTTESLGEGLLENVKRGRVEQHDLHSLEAGGGVGGKEVDDGLQEDRRGARLGETKDAGGNGRQPEGGHL